jgi:WG containing repeat
MRTPVYRGLPVAIAFGLSFLLPFGSSGVAQSSLDEQHRAALELQISLRAMADSAFAERFPQATVPRLLWFSNGQRIGFLRKSGETAIPPVFQGAELFVNGDARVNLNGRWGVVTASEQVRLFQFADVSVAKGGLYFIKVNGLSGLIDAQEHVVAEPTFERIEYWGDKYAVRRGGKWGILDSDGSELVEPRYQQIFLPSDKDRLGAAIEGRWGVVDKNGTVLLPFQYERAKTLPHGFTAVVKNRKWMLLAPDGMRALPGSYDLIRGTSKSTHWIVEEDGQQGIVDLQGVYILRMDRWRIESFGTDGAFIVSNRSAAIADSDGQLVTDFVYDKVQPLVESLAAVKVNGKWGYINSRGTPVIPPSFDMARPFAQGLAAVSMGDRYGYIDRTGSQSIPIQV